MSIERILARRGAAWTREEQDEVRKWLYESKQKRNLLAFILICVGDWANSQDAEDAWQGFCMSRLDRLIKDYDPAKGKFWNFLLFRVLFYCLRIKEREQKRRFREKTISWPPPSERLHVEYQLRLSADFRTEPNYIEHLHAQQTVSRLLGMMQKQFPHYVEVIVKYHLLGKSIKEIATEQEETPVAIKVRLFRARQELRSLLDSSNLRWNLGRKKDRGEE